LWQQGEPMPQPLGDMLSELSSLDEQLTVLRAQRYARVEAEGDVPEGDDSAAEGESAPEGEDNVSETEAAPDGADWESELNEAGEAADSPDAAGEDDTRPDLRPVEPDPIDEGETGGNA
jgi:hypothetical protein